MMRSLTRAILLFAAHVVLLTGVATAQNSCSDLIPPDGAYDRIRSYLSVEKRDYLDEISYVKDFGSHDDALKFGVSLGVPIYNVPLQIGGTFDSANKDEWRKEYLTRRKHDVEVDVQRMLTADLLNVAVVRIVADCIQMFNPGLWVTVGIINDCDFSVRAGYTPESFPGPRIIGSITATHATCDPLPKKPLPPKGFVIDCHRTSFEDAHVTLRTAHYGDRDRVLPTLLEPMAPQMQTHTETVTVQQNVSRGQATQVYGDQNCPDCQTKYGIPFSVPGPITAARLLSGPPPFVVACPDGGKCGNIPSLFRYADASDCAGKTTCFVWFLERNNNTPAVYTISIDYQLSRRECVANCRTPTRDEAAEATAHNQAHKDWETMRTTRCKPAAAATR
jgi:hypothetical protein